MSKSIVIVGGGIIGLSSAFYLQKSGHQVVVLDQGDFLNNCSYGNAGYVCPSHFIPLATPGIVRDGFRWMLDSKSPFYVQPRLNASLISWGLQFMKSATPEKVTAAAVPLRDIALLSQAEFLSWSSLPGFNFNYAHKGLLEIFQTPEKGEHAVHTVERAQQLGLDTVLLSKDELAALEPQTRINALGAILFKCDAHLFPNRLMQCLLAHLRAAGVKLHEQVKVTGFEKQNGKITKVLSQGRAFSCDELIIAAGSWSRELASELNTKIPLVPGRGYSVTLENSAYKVNHPAVLMEGRVAITPVDENVIRFGGTMEITATNSPPRYKRVQGILDSVKRFYPLFDATMPSKDKIWWGYRPCSADGLPYIGRIRAFSNVVVGTGHSMLGLSLGAGSGRLISEIINGQEPAIDMRPFDVERFN